MFPVTMTQGRREGGTGGVKVPGPGLLGGPDSSDGVKGSKGP